MRLNIKSGVLVLLLTVIAMSSFAAPAIVKGFLDLRNEDLSSNKVALKGTWYYFENQFVSSIDVNNNGKGLTQFPQVWNESREPDTGAGYASYALFILAPANIKSLSVQIPQLYSSYTLFVNDKPVASNGKIGKTAAESVPQWLPQTASFQNTGDTIKLILQISNFHHFKGGAKEIIYLGSTELMNDDQSIALFSQYAEVIILTFIALIFLLIYITTKRKRIVIYFALLCLTWAIRTGFSRQYLFITYQPDFNWTAMVKIEYITLFLTMIWGVLYLSRVFPKEENKIFKYLLVGSNLLFIGFTLVSDPVAFTQWLPLYLSFCGILLLYAVFIVLWGWINQRLGANFLTGSILLGAFIFTYDVFSYEGTFSYNPVIQSSAYILIFILLSITLLLHLNIIKSNQKSITKLTYKDLYKEIKD